MQKMVSSLKLFIQIYYNPVSNRILKTIFFTRSLPLWPILYGVWIFFIIQRSTLGCYLSLLHKVILGLIMSLVNDGVLYFFPPKDLPVSVKIGEKLKLYLIFTGYTIVFSTLFVIFNLLKSRVSTVIVKYLTLFAISCGSMCQIRLFKYVVQALKGLDERLVLIVALAMMLWVHIIDYVSRKITRRRNQIFITKPITIVFLLVEGAITYSITRKSAISAMLGLQLPFNFALLFMLIFVFVTYSIACLLPLLRRRKTNKIN